ncbi:sensor histidine kinase [Lysobacter korlensis]|uniref:Oxygen sensor histidine kinase NreB n=1 Tax=Lysobacter korlensis TaxID=553636 RepID=A0ABV6RJ70_9GAMM
MPDTPVPMPPAECERQLLALADALPVGVVVVQDGRVYAVNSVAARQFAAQPRALSGCLAQALFADPDAAAALLDEPPVQERQLSLRRADGELFRAELSARALEVGGRALRLLFVCDLSESDRIRDQLERQHDELQAMTRRVLSVQEDERRTLSHELHDDIGQQITAIKLGAMALQDDTDPVRRAEILAEIIEITDQTVAKVRNLSLLLRPPQLDALGLEAALRWQAGTMFRNGRPKLELDIEPLPARPPPAVELACFRIAQESLTNVLRHAQARHVTLRLARQDDSLTLEVSDDGRGFSGDDANGLGLVTMRERAQQVGGRLDVDSDPAHGTRVRAELPLQHPEPDR